MRNGARALPAAETWATFRSLVEGSFASSYPEATLATAWLNLTLNDHGIAGEPTPKNASFNLPEWFVNENSPDQWDLVYADKWQRALEAGVDIASSSQAWLAGHVNTTAAAVQPPAGGAVVTVFNSLSWVVDQPVEVVMSPCAPGAVMLTDAATGAAVAAQTDFYDQTNCTIVFVAKRVPSFGYATFIASAPAAAAAAATTAAAPASELYAPGDPWTAPFANSFYTITPAVGGLSSVVDLATGQELFDTSQLLAGEWISLTYSGMGASETRSYDHATADATFQRLSQFAGATWSCLEAGPVRTVFGTAPVQTNHSIVSLHLVIFAEIKRLDLRVQVDAWDSAFGFANRIAFPVRSSSSNVTYAVPFGVVRVGLDEAENGADDVWLQRPGPEVPQFERAWAIHPREVSDWIHAEGDGVGVMISSSVGVFDFSDCSGRYPGTQPVLQPELMLHTDSNRGPFLPEPGDHRFLHSIIATAPGAGWRTSWRAAAETNNPATATWTPSASAPPPSPDAWLPLRAGLLSVVDAGGAEDPGAWVTALKKQDDGVAEARSLAVVRVFNVDGADRPDLSLRVDLPARGGGTATLAGAARTNLIELDPVDVPGVAGTALVPAPLGHWAIETYALDFGV